MELSAARLAQHPAIEPELFLKPTQAALVGFHKPPTTKLITEHEGADRELELTWAAPNERVATSKQRPDIVDDGAVGIALLLVLELTEWKVTDIVQRGEGPDYWLGKAPCDHTLHLEISGTDQQNLASIVTKKTAQLLRGGVGGYVSVCRFDEPRAHFNLHGYDAQSST